MGIKGFVRRYFTPVDDLSPKINNFNVIRLFAAFLVIYGHMDVIMGVPGATVLGQRVSTVAAKIFFIVSGYLITKSYLSDRSFPRYMVRRVFRIFPALIAVTLLSVFVLGPLVTTLRVGEYFSNPDTWAYLKNIILYPVYGLPGVFTDCPYPGAVNGSIWILPVEFAMYLVIPFLAILFRKGRSLKPVVFVLAILTLVLDVLYHALFPELRFVFYGTNWPSLFALLPYFFFGSFFSFPEMRKYLNLQAATVLVILVSFLRVSVGVNELLVGLVLPYFILSLALVERPLFGNWFRKCDFSYGIYLFGFPIQQVLFALLGKFSLSLGTMAILSFVVALPFAMASWYGVERFGQQLGARILSRMKRT